MKRVWSVMGLLMLATAMLLTGVSTAYAEEGLFASVQETAKSPEWVTKLEAAEDESVSQIFVVAGLGLDKTTAIVSMHERDADGEWNQVLSTPAFVGKYGLCLDQDHREGCAQTPIGTYHFNAAFGIAADPGCAIPYVQVDENTYWSGDAREGMHYNEMVDIRDFPDLEMDDSEHIIDYSYEYQYCLNISFNEDGTPGRGSAIFLHCFGIVKPYTGGCVALPEYIMKQVMQRVQPDCVVVIDILLNLSGEEYPGSGPAGESANPAAEAAAYDDVQYVIYLGTNDRDSNEPVFSREESLAELREILNRSFGGYTIQEAYGGWLDDDGTEFQEYTLVIYLSDTSKDQIYAAADEMIETFHQSSVLIQANPTRTEFYSGT